MVSFSRIAVVAFFLPCLWLTGCGELRPFRQQNATPSASEKTTDHPALFARLRRANQNVPASEKNGDTASSPPRPAPALYIPGSPRPAMLASASRDVETLPLTVAPSEKLQTQVPQIPSGVPAAVITQNPTPADQPAANPLRNIHTQAMQRFQGMDSYIMRLKRREVVGNQKKPEELLMCKFRKEPWSVYFKWIGTEAKGREALYVKGQSENVIHTLTATGDIIFMPGGKHFKVSPDSILVKSKSRYPITEAGIGVLIDRFGRMVDAVEKGDPREGTAKYLGLVQRPEFENKVEAVVQGMGPGIDPNFPRGGQRTWYFDSTHHLPVLIVSQDETGQEVEYYCHDRFIFNPGLTDDDFNPGKLWKLAKS